MKVLLVNPPLANPFGPYPAICYLAGFLDTLGYRVELADAGLALLLQIFSRAGIHALAEEIRRRSVAGSLEPSASTTTFLDRADQYADTIETAIAALQGCDHGAVSRARRRNYFPPSMNPSADWAEATYLSAETYRAMLGELSSEQMASLASASEPLRYAFGPYSETDEACFRASRVIADLERVIRHTLDPDFAINAYAEKLSDTPKTFAPIRTRLMEPPGLIDRWIDSIATDLLERHAPDVVGLSVPFSGTLYGALRMAAAIKSRAPEVRIVLGGGWVNTVLRDLTCPEIFDYVDYITLDDGERPLQCLLEHFEGRRSESHFARTFRRVDGNVTYTDASGERDIPASETGTPTYRDLPVRKYLLYRPSVQSFNQGWGRRWNKLTLAHGCYWKKCAFCDTSLDYISRYEPATVDVLFDRILRLQRETGESGFHFVDEAMPPSIMRRLAERLVHAKANISWRGNVRFESALIPIAPVVAASGCVGISGGLEVASDRVLALMKKGVSLGQAARVCGALSSEGIRVHAYLIYGFPTQTIQETIDALEYVRQMFAARVLHSVAWHRFILTAFSPVAAYPERFGIEIETQSKGSFGNYELKYHEISRVNHDAFADGLNEAVWHYELGVGLNRPVTSWFREPMPSTTLSTSYVRDLIATPEGTARRRLSLLSEAD